MLRQSRDPSSPQVENQDLETQSFLETNRLSSESSQPIPGTVCSNWGSEVDYWSKSGPPSKGDDRLILWPRGSNPLIAAVVDGASDKNGLTWLNGMGGAATLAQATQRAALKISYPFDFTVFVARVNWELQTVARRCGHNLFACEERNRPSASMVLADLMAMRVYLIGDCQFGYECNEEFTVVSPTLRVDALTTGLRKLFIEFLKQEDLLSSLEGGDPGRLLISDLLAQQYLLRNHLPDTQREWIAGLQMGSEWVDIRKFADYIQSRGVDILDELWPGLASSHRERSERFFQKWVIPSIEAEGLKNPARQGIVLPVNKLHYSILDGVTIPAFTTYHLPSGTSKILLASDGIPALEPTLMKCKNTLKAMLSSDPWCIDAIRGTKAFSDGRISYDDGSIIQLTLGEA